MKMKIHYKLWKLIPMVVLSISSCTDYLSITPDNRTEVAEYYNSAQRVNQAVIGTYVDLRRALLTNHAWLMYGEARAGDLTVEVGYQALVASQRLNVDQYNLNQISDWEYFYDVIASANNVMEIVSSADPTLLTEYQHQLYLGEALALKSMAYFYLARIWGDIPSGEASDLGQKLTSAEAIDRAMTFADKAKELLPWMLLNDDGIESTALTAVRFNKSAATMLFAQEALWAGKNQEAETALEELSADEAKLSGLGLSMGVDRRTDIPQTPLSRTMVSMPLDKLNKIYPVGDQRRSSLFTISDGQSGATLIVKDASTLEILKLSELNLLRSEAAWKVGKVDKAIEYMLIATEGSTEDYTTLSDEAFADALLLERQRILVGTGQRFFDLIRFGKISKFVPSLSPAAVENGATYWPLSAGSIRDNALTQSSYWSNQQSQ
ncbi:RagB/SusD family nutrient uptake outer membrane protein [Dyadobacter tibetensis]|uniref:RagB/SusD family nutrient uptake outer membrane protein n=1 Tax=Dyadobacter tibetensis TaxID=1211851 RepID=UPI0004704B1F|nr:RagB/SusD family nutrient uptake outer membrane protein [Dyadobacter tibetensis]